MSPFATAAVAFDELLSRIELNPTRVQLASSRYAALKSQLESALPGTSVKQVGSFQRKTKIRPADESDELDIDAIVCFGDAQVFLPIPLGVSTEQAINTVRGAITVNRTYAAMKPKTDAPTVVVEYSGDRFKIELIPCYRDMTGQRPRPLGPACYLIGSSSGLWIPADYDFDAQFISGLNQSPPVAKALVPAIKMVKTFLRNRQFGLKSFYVEVLCGLVLPSALSEWEAKGLRWGYQHILAHFLSNAGNYLPGPVSIPGSYSPPVENGLNTFLAILLGGDPSLLARQKSQAMADLGRQAWEICRVEDQQRDTSRALAEWRQFFGDPFPA